MIINDEYIKNIFNTSQIHESKIKSLSDDILKYLNNRYKDSTSIKETIFRIINNIEIHPKCPECNKLVKVKYRKETPFYSTCGDPNCIHKRKGNGPKEACIKKYGLINVFQLDEVKEKIKKVCLQKYGVEHHSQSNIWKKNQINKLIERYGVINQFQRNEVKEKIKKVCLQKYGVEHYNQSNDFKQKMSLIASSNEFQNKRNNTLSKNHTWNTSKDEEYIFDKLLHIFTNVKRQYKSNLYPYNCDFYIPQIDTYIEYQGSDLHNGRPYIGNDNDLKEIKIFNEKSQQIKNKTGKNKTRYDNRIIIWSIKDVEKRNIAKQNNLNYLEFWNIDEFNNWINKFNI